ncbi:MAG: copper homeostasis protein CutC [Cetobacterium sp.]|nr:copper homeostasis protein CutC [Cetobacterium sp.]
MIKEVCVENFDQAFKAWKKGANRIELCENLYVGGTTPSYGTVKKAIEILDIPIFPMIRPRGGNFIYSPSELEIMKEDIKLFKSLKVPGIVLGFLTENNEIDFNLLEEFVNLAKPMEVTFHKAIDEIENPLNSIEKLKKIGIKRILSSGKEETALKGKNLLNKMIQLAHPEIKIVVAGKVTHENFKLISESIKSSEYHGKIIINY